MAQYCQLCNSVTNCTDDCRQCLREEERLGIDTKENQCYYDNTNQNDYKGRN